MAEQHQEWLLPAISSQNSIHIDIYTQPLRFSILQHKYTFINNAIHRVSLTLSLISLTGTLFPQMLEIS